jgi:hypothetical protein
MALILTAADAAMQRTACNLFLLIGMTVLSITSARTFLPALRELSHDLLFPQRKI